MSFLNMNISASCMIFVILFIRKIFLHKIPHVVFGVLWSLVILRLYIPYEIKTDFNFYNTVYAFREFLLENNIFQLEYETYYLDRTLIEWVRTSIAKEILLFIWLIGVMVMGCCFLKEYLLSKRLWKRAISSVACEKAQCFLREKGLYKKIEIRQSQEIQTSMACGILHQGILIPVDFEKVSKDAFGQVLLHEYMHLKCYHPFLQVIVISILCINWFNPMVWIWYHFINRDMEVSCDRHVLDFIGEKEKEGYASNLIDMAKLQSEEGAFRSGFTKKMIKERVVAIMKYKKATILTVAISMLIPMGVASAFGTSDTYLFGDEIEQSGLVFSIEPGEAGEATKTLQLTYEELAPYVDQQESRAASSISIKNYKYVVNGGSLPTTLTISTEQDGYTYSGTLKLVNMEIDGSKYIGYYSGTLYRK